MKKPDQPVSKMAVEILYNGIGELPHPDAGSIKLVYFGHKSDGQKKITRQVSEAIVMKLESNGMHIVNGLSEAEALLAKNGYVVLAPGDERLTYLRDAAGPGEAPTEAPQSLVDVRNAMRDILGGVNA